MDLTLGDKLNALQQISQRKLVEILDAIAGAKDLIIEQRLMKILDSFVGVTVLKKYGVEKIFKLEQGLKPTNSQRIFLVTKDLIICKRVLDQIQSELVGSTEKLSYHLLVAPLTPAVLRSLVEEEGLSGLITIHTLSWEFIRVDGNVLSLETPMFNDLYYHKDPSLLPALARSLWSLQLVFGAPKQTLTFGKYSQKIVKIIESLEMCLGSSSADDRLGALIIMDRDYDLASPLLTPVTYSALLSEVISVNVGTASLGSSQTKLDPSKDKVYEEARDAPCSNVFPTLHEKAKSLKAEQEAIQAMKLDELQHYVSNRLQKIRDLTRHLAFHISACEAITDSLGSQFQDLQTMEKLILECRNRKECINYIEKNIDEHPLRSLRLLCLLSIVNDGISSNDLKSIQKSHLHAHGYKRIPLFYKLESIGLLKQKSENLLRKLPTNRNSEWLNFAQRLKLLPSSSRSEMESRMCPSYVFNGAYVPAIAQILSITVNQDKDAKSFEDLKNVQGCVINNQRSSLLPKTVVVCVIGGITNAEIAACRQLERATGIRLVVASDCLVTGNGIIESVQDI